MQVDIAEAEEESMSIFDFREPTLRMVIACINEVAILSVDSFG